MLKLIALIIALVLWLIWLKKQSNKEEEIYYKRMQEVIKDAIKQALNEREEEFINDDAFGPFDDEDEMSNEEKIKSYTETTDDNHYRAMSGMEKPTNENLDSYEHLEEKRKAVEETIDSIVDVID